MSYDEEAPCMSYSQQYTCHACSMRRTHLSKLPPGAGSVSTALRKRMLDHQLVSED